MRCAEVPFIRDCAEMAARVLARPAPSPAGASTTTAPTTRSATTTDWLHHLNLRKSRRRRDGVHGPAGGALPGAGRRVQPRRRRRPGTSARSHAEQVATAGPREIGADGGVPRSPRAGAASTTPMPRPRPVSRASSNSSRSPRRSPTLAASEPYLADADPAVRRAAVAASPRPPRPAPARRSPRPWPTTDAGGTRRGRGLPAGAGRSPAAERRAARRPLLPALGRRRPRGPRHRAGRPARPAAGRRRPASRGALSDPAIEVRIAGRTRPGLGRRRSMRSPGRPPTRPARSASRWRAGLDDPAAPRSPCRPATRTSWSARPPSPHWPSRAARPRTTPRRHRAGRPRLAGPRGRGHGPGRGRPGPRRPRPGQGTRRPNADVRKAAVLALLRHSAREDARAALATAVTDPDADVRAYASRAATPA